MGAEVQVGELGKLGGKARHLVLILGKLVDCWADKLLNVIMGKE